MKEKIVEIKNNLLPQMEGFMPKIAIVLGSGLDGFAEELSEKVIIDYKNIKGFPQTTVEGHKGRFILGKIGNTEVLCMQGRFHYYEGFEKEIAIPVYLFKELEIKELILTNAAGSLHKKMSPGSLMMLTDHINNSPFIPLRGANDEKIGPRFVDMSQAYNLDIQKKIINAAKQEKIKLFKGVYSMHPGPCFETPAEIRKMQKEGADAVGMSTVPEVVFANHCGLPVGAISVLTNYAAGMIKQTLSHEQTLRMANMAVDKVKALLKRYILNTMV